MQGVSRRAWRTLFAAQIGWMLDAADFLLFTFALRAIQVEFGFSSRQMGFLTTVALIAAAVGGILFGRLADRIGRVRAMTWSMIVFSIGTAALASSQSLAQLALWRVVVGLGMGGEWSSGSVLVSETWPAEHRAKASGIMQSGWAIGALIAAGLSALVLERFGWRVLFLLGAFPALVALWIRRTIPEPEIWIERQVPSPESRVPGLLTPDSGPRTGDQRQVPSSEVRVPGLLTRDSGPGTRDPFWTMFRDYGRVTLTASLLAASVLVAYWGLFSWLPGFLATPIAEGGAGLTLTRSALWIILVQLGAFAGYISFGWIADKLGRRPAFALFMVAAAVVVPMYALVPSAQVLMVVGPMVGFFGSGYFSVFGAMLSELYPTSIRATAQGFCYNIGRLASAAAPFVIGVGAERFGLGVALTINSLFFIVGGIVVWLLPETRGTRLT